MNNTAEKAAEIAAHLHQFGHYVCRTSISAHPDAKFATFEEAIAAYPDTFVHYKGGVYRLLQTGVIHADSQEDLVLYEHLWPHEHKMFVRSREEFFGWNEQGLVRFTPVNLLFESIRSAMEITNQQGD